MSQRSWRLLAALFAFPVLLSCEESPTGPPEEEPLGPTELRSFVVLPPAEPAVGTQFIISFGVKRGTEAAKVGSFGATIKFDPTAIEFISADPGAGATVAVNQTTPGTLLVAGASAEGFTTESLASATVKLLKADAFKSVSSTVEELTSSELADLKPALTRVSVTRLPVFNR